MLKALLLTKVHSDTALKSLIGLFGTLAIVIFIGAPAPFSGTLLYITFSGLCLFLLLVEASLMILRFQHLRYQNGESLTLSSLSTSGLELPAVLFLACLLTLYAISFIAEDVAFGIFSIVGTYLVGAVCAVLIGLFLLLIVAAIFRFDRKLWQRSISFFHLDTLLAPVSIRVIAALLLLTHLWDWWITGVGVYNFGITAEANPLAEVIISEFGFWSLFSAKLSVYFICFAVSKGLYLEFNKNMRSTCQKAFLLTLVITTFFVTVVRWHAFFLLQGKELTWLTPYEVYNTHINGDGKPYIRR